MLKVVICTYDPYVWADFEKKWKIFFESYELELG